MTDSFEQLQLDGMDAFEVPAKYMPTQTITVSDLPEWRSYKVSESGQFTVSATARERWSMREGGEVNVFDVDGAVVIFPTDIHPDTAKELIKRMFYIDADVLPTKTTVALGITGIINQVRPEFG